MGQQVKVPPFVNRERELEELMGYAWRGFYPVLFVYGPEGCGKTRLLQELYSRLKSQENFITVYVDAEAVGTIEEALVAPEPLAEAVKELLRGAGGPIGAAVAQTIPTVLRRLARSLLKGKHVVIAVDDFARHLPAHVAEAYVKRLLKLLEDMLNAGAESVLIVAATGEASSLDLLARHTYVATHMLWNLDFHAATELMKKLNAPQNIVEEAYRLTGGNPRAIVELQASNWNLEAWLSMVKRRLQHVLVKLVHQYPSQLKEVVENIDSLLDHSQLLEEMTRYNLVTPIIRPCLGHTPAPSQELGIGKYYAWQLPAYMHLARQALKEHNQP